MTAKRTLGQFTINPIGLGCMCLSHGYGDPTDEADAARLLHRALDIGYDFLDTAAIYGSGHNEELIGRVLKARRGEFVLASKCGFGRSRRDPQPDRFVDGRPEAIDEVLDLSLGRLGVEHIDLYYLHRPDPLVPIEESVGALARAVEAGKIGAIGLSEVSADQLRRAHATHPIAALQTEYSLWTRNPEIAGLAACRDLGVTFVAFSPVGRGFLAGALADRPALSQDDMRRVMPRFIDPQLTHNLAWFAEYRAMADEIGCTPAQLALAWLLQRDPALVTIPGTTSIGHLEENMAAGGLSLSPERMDALDALINQRTVAGARYTPAMQRSVATEEFA
ncbi:aldo/keto reductase [Rhizorhabdus dicambivorans]|uniref:Aldo/keto reductase n=1 Tax=Rhizorhabdus dicambivorans TaxID=1850238 RepID=A0A2A4G157_9SPHN|nr:aldo/keto reductase [Rhizorhabdus dicambivorans]ATE63303.1 aldo/keto reductase [Rhizorhabdus dicambivorans]PCE43517.1 aldo/keto reductase [Rhizorhabdus dicambivorans]